MPSSRITNSLYNICPSHLFSYFSQNLPSSCKRVAKIVLQAFFALGTSYAAYRIISQGIHSIFQNKIIPPYSDLGNEAFEFARKKLTEHLTAHPDMTIREMPNGAKPTIEEIAKLRTLMIDVSYKNFLNLLNENQEDPWSNPKVIEAADELMKIAFVISNLTLEDLKPYTEKLASQGFSVTQLQLLTYQGCYHYRAFFHCTDIYHWLRRAARAEGKDFNDPYTAIPEEHALPFYQKGTIQNSWNLLYNEYCDRVRTYVGERELRKDDDRFIKWTRKDTGVDTFCGWPSPQPT